MAHYLIKYCKIPLVPAKDKCQRNIISELFPSEMIATASETDASGYIADPEHGEPYFVKK